MPGVVLRALLTGSSVLVDVLSAKEEGRMLVGPFQGCWRVGGEGQESTGMYEDEVGWSDNRLSRACTMLPARLDLRDYSCGVDAGKNS